MSSVRRGRGKSAVRAVVRRGVERAAIIIIFTSPRVIKAARYTCSVRGRPLPAARTIPLAGVVGVAAARGRGGHSLEGAKRRSTEGREFGFPVGCSWIPKREDRR